MSCREKWARKRDGRAVAASWTVLAPHATPPPHRPPHPAGARPCTSAFNNSRFDHTTRLCKWGSITPTANNRRFEWHLLLRAADPIFSPYIFRAAAGLCTVVVSKCDCEESKQLTTTNLHSSFGAWRRR
jgi:hypothetical protein